MPSNPSNKKGPLAARRAKVSPAGLEDQREALLARLKRLHAGAETRPAYRTALKLLNPIFRRADLGARVAVLQAANFVIEILERTPPLL